MADVLTSPLLHVRIDSINGVSIVRLTRTVLPLTLEGLAALEPLLAAAVPREGRPHQRLLLDTRAAPLLANEDLERKLGTASAFFFEGFSRRAVLVRTAVGGLQARRFGRAYHNETQVFSDEEAALTFLTT